VPPFLKRRRGRTLGGGQPTDLKPGRARRPALRGAGAARAGRVVKPRVQSRCRMTYQHIVLGAPAARAQPTEARRAAQRSVILLVGLLARSYVVYYFRVKSYHQYTGARTVRAPLSAW
jgi:hypothetical protein